MLSITRKYGDSIFFFTSDGPIEVIIQKNKRGDPFRALIDAPRPVKICRKPEQFSEEEVLQVQEMQERRAEA